MGSQVANTASTAGEGASTYGQMAEVGGGAASSAPSAGGFTIEPASTGAQAGPTVDAANVQEYGTTDPSYLQQAGNVLDRFQKGGGQNLSETYKNFGNNPETYGAAYGLVSRMAGSGKPAAAPAITTNISTQQPENPYLKKRGRY